MAPKLFRTTKRSDCKKRFVHLKKYMDDGGYQLLNGLRSTKKNHIHVSHDYNQFEVTPTPIPAGFMENTDVDPGWLDKYQCRDAAKRPTKGLDVEQWSRATRAKWLTIADVQHMAPGATLEVVLLDRNVIDTIDAAGVKPNKLHTPKSFFAASKATYTHTKGLEGTLTLLADGKPLVLTPFEFDVEFDGKDNWYPLTGGFLPAKDPDGFLKLLGKRTHWSAMSPATHIGWRGPMIPWSALSALPKVFRYKA